MGTFTALTSSDLAAIADRFGLGAVRAATPIAAGTINSNFDVTTERGRWFVRVNEGKSAGDVAWEAQLVTALARGGVPVVEQAGVGEALGKLVTVYPWRAGVHLAPAEVTVDHARVFGGALARLHVVGLALPAAWRRTSIYDHAHLVARYERFASSGDPELAHAIEVLGDELAAAAAAQATRAAATHGLIHGDLFRDNVLWEGRQLSALLDFEQASGGSLAYDLAVCINDWCWTGAPRLDLASALVDGYRSVRVLPREDRAALPIEVRAAAARFTITRITDVYLARVDNPEKDFRAFLARCLAWRGPALGQLTAAL
ncbi:MAG TPA: homoserine kinase [Kofleriaceae bacterium]|nr:homoserine kinase [Kofleriaceae bacterium]